MERVKVTLRDHPRLSWFFFIYYVAFLIYGAVNGASQTIFYAVFIGGGALLVAHLDGRANLSSIVLWGLAIWGFAHMLGGLVEIGGEAIYERSWGGGEFRFDKVVHFFGFGMATLTGYELIRKRLAPDAEVRGVAIAACFVGLGVGAINETIEFLITLLPLESNVGGFSNTGWDLVANTLGAVTAASLAPSLPLGTEAA